MQIAVGSDTGPALLDLPGDPLELGERIVFYRLRSTGMICTRGRGGCCRLVGTYTPEGVDVENSKTFWRELREAAGLTPALRLTP